MFKILVKGLKDGTYDIDMQQDASTVPDMFPEFQGVVNLIGTLTILGKRFSFIGKANCDAKLICDISLTEFTENISAEISASYIADNNLLNDNVDPDRAERIISEDDKYIDLTEIIREELAVSLPMKRIAPEYRNKNFDEVFPQFSANSAPETSDDDRWAALKDINLDLDEKKN